MTLPLQAQVGLVLVVFDGQVVELFGPTGSANTSADTSRRYHVGNLRLVVDGPDRRGRRSVQLSFALRSPLMAYRGYSELRAEEAEWADLGPLVAAVTAAIDAVGLPG